MRKILTALLVFLSPLSFAQEKVSLADISLKTLDNQTVTFITISRQTALYQNVGILVSNLLSGLSGN